MKPNPVHRLPAPLENAVQRLKMAAREAAERTIESLGLAALASTNAFHRDGLLGAQFELNRKSAVFVLTFNDTLDDRITRELGPQTADPGAALTAHTEAAAPPTNWDALSLVEDREVEAQISAERFGLEISHSCEWELRELGSYVSALLRDAGGERDRNPLRADLIGHAMMRGIEAVSDRADTRKVLSTEFSRSLATQLQAAYADILADMRRSGVQPSGLAVRGRAPRGQGGVQDSGNPASSLHADDDAALAAVLEAERRALSRSGHGTVHGGLGGGAPRGMHAAPGYGHGSYQSSQGGRLSAHGTLEGALASRRASSWRGASSFGQVDPALMALIRRLAHQDGGDAAGWSGYGDGETLGPVPNVIRAHRDELRAAAPGSVDHMVIDVIGFLFDQIMADPNVPPQLARQIARLQLPVLRAALGDPSFFASRRHPVRRFVNRIASLGAAYDDLVDERGRSFLAKVKALVQQVIDGEFDQIDVYESKLAELEAFTAEQARNDLQAEGDGAALLAEKEDQQRLRQLYAQRLAGDLKDVSAPPFLRDFISRTWSQVLLRAAEQGGAEGQLAQRMRAVGSDLFMSVQPKVTPTHRKAFLAELPRLMQGLTEGMNLIAWPEARRRDFFGQLMPAHAEALRSTTGRTLDINLMARQVEGALQRGLPSRADLKAAPPPDPKFAAEDAAEDAGEEAGQSSFSADEARRVGLVTEAAVNWTRRVDIDVSGGPPAAAGTPGSPAPAKPPPAPALPGIPESTEAPEPTSGRALADAVQIGYPYQIQLDDKWQRARLTHVSPGRSFFMFTLGTRHKKTVSLTQRMLQRLCETGRLRAFESAYLMERATERARRQLASLGGRGPGLAGAGAGS